MRHWITYPLAAHPCQPEFVTREGITRFARAAEAAGFHGLGFTDHPAPSHKWLMSGGHDALDPFVALTLVAAVTERLRLIPNILVLPYRNPFLVAKAAATLDALSDGRFVLSVATGYLRSEYRSLGVDFDRRNELFDEALEVRAGGVVARRVRLRGTGVHGIGCVRQPEAGPRAHLDRRQQRADSSSGGHSRRRLEPLPGARPAGADLANRAARGPRRARPDARPPLASCRRSRS